MPDGLDARAGLFRSLTVDRRLLLLLDNASDAAQVRPLIPGSSRSLAVVTSRSQLGGLVTVEAAATLTVEPMSVSESRRFLIHRLGPEWCAADPAAVDVVVRRCQGLPIALAIIAGQAIRRPAATPGMLARQVHLAALGDGDATGDLRAVFSSSYRALAPAPARLFRLLSVHPAGTVTSAELSAVAGEDVGPASAELIRAHLLTETGPGVHTCHDLLREYAAELAEHLDSASERRAALGRLLAQALGGPAELALRLSLVRRAALNGFAVEADRLVWGAEADLRLQGRWRELEQVARTAAELAPEPEAEARLRYATAEARFQLGDLDGAETAIRRVSALPVAADLKRATLMLSALIR